jgi:flagellar FliL protein
MSHQPAAEAQHDEASKPKGPGVMTLIKAVAFVSIIVLLETAAATMFIPTAEETKQMGEQLVHAAKGEEEVHADHAPAAHAEHDASGAHGADTREVSLGTYHVVSFNPSTGTSLSIDFELFGIVLASEEEEFVHLFEIHEKRLKEQVTIAIRGMQASDFTDPGLGLIKRIILEKTNRALGEPLVREAVFSEFSFIER